MPSLNSVFRKLAILSLFVLLLLHLAPRQGFAETSGKNSSWLWQPWIGTAGGYESDLILDPDFTRQVVPGGAFLELSPGFRLSRPLSRSTNFRILNRNTIERFFNDEGRTLFASSLFGDFRFKGKSAFRGRATLNGDYFNDSGSDSFRRWSAGGEIGAGAHFTRWGFEISGYLQGRSYPNVLVQTDDFQTQTYTENQRGLAGYLIWSPQRRLFLKGTYNRRNTDSVDPAYESTSYTASGTLEYLLGKGTWISANLTGQEREFDNRLPGEDSDSYIQAGIGVRQTLTPQVNLSLRYARSEYTYTQGGEQNTNRFAVGVNWQFGKKSLPIERLTIDPQGAGTVVFIEGEPVLLRLHAPGAKSVSVAGTFNGWNPSASPLENSEDGWWEIALTLVKGTYEFLYVVDGVPMVPPEAARTVADGFGGNNGVLEIIPAQR